MKAGYIKSWKTKLQCPGNDVRCDGKGAADKGSSLEAAMRARLI